MDLPQTLSYRGWTIRYTLLRPTPTTSTTRATPLVQRPTVFVHGTPWASTTFVPLATALAAQSSTPMLLYDLPGYGQSQEYQRQACDLDGSLFEGDTSVKFQGEALAALLHHLQLDGKNGNQAPAVIAHDIAGAIVLRAHLLLGCQFSSLLLIDTNAVLPWGDHFYNLVRSAPQIFTNLPPHTFEALLRATIQSASHQPSKLHPGGWEDILAAPWLPTPSSAPAPAPVPQRQHQHNFVRQIAQATDTDVAELLHRNLYRHVRCPVKILWGAHDAWIPREKLERLAHLLGERVEEFVVVPEAGHLVMVDQPERVAVEVLSWLARKV